MKISTSFDSTMRSETEPGLKRLLKKLELFLKRELLEQHSLFIQLLLGFLELVEWFDRNGPSKWLRHERWTESRKRLCNENCLIC